MVSYGHAVSAPQTTRRACGSVGKGVKCTDQYKDQCKNQCKRLCNAVRSYPTWLKSKLPFRVHFQPRFRELALVCIANQLFRRSMESGL